MAFLIVSVRRAPHLRRYRALEGQSYDGMPGALQPRPPVNACRAEVSTPFAIQHSAVLHFAVELFRAIVTGIWEGILTMATVPCTAMGSAGKRSDIEIRKTSWNEIQLGW